MSAILHSDILECLPKMRGFARRLTRDRSMADDLVQTAVMRALSNADKFMPGSNFRAWITTILRNSYFNEIRTRARRPMVDFDVEKMAGSISGGQEDRLHIRDFGRAFRLLPPAQRRALLLVGADGLTYEEAAEVEACAAGTMKSRVSRARLQLRQFLKMDDVIHRPVGAPAPRVGRSSVLGRQANRNDAVAAA